MCFLVAFFCTCFALSDVVECESSFAIPNGLMVNPLHMLKIAINTITTNTNQTNQPTPPRPV